MSDEDPPEGDQQKAAVSFQELVDGLPVALAVGALAVYGVLIAGYSQFYAELGVRPTEVGLVFGPALGGIAGMTVILVLLVASAFAVALVYLKLAQGHPAASRWLENRKRPELYLLGIIVLLISGFLLYASIDNANDAADAAKRGEPVEPFDPLGLEIYAFRADLAEVTRIDSGPESSPVADVRLSEPLLYLGRSGSTLVLYDIDTQSSVHLPTSSYVVRTLNCETSQENRHDDCPND